MATILEVNLQNRQELKILPKGEYELTVAGVKAHGTEEGEDDSPRLNVRCESVDEPLADDIYYTVWLPSADDSDKQTVRKVNDIAAFMALLGLDNDVSQIDIDEWIGCNFRAILGVDTWQGKKKNIIKELVGKSSSASALSSADPDDDISPVEVVDAEEV